MRRVLLWCSIIAFVVTTTTFAGMAFLGMEPVMSMSHGTCVGAECGPMANGVAETNCVDHCLTLVPTSAPAPSLASLIALLIAMATFVLLSRIAMGRDIRTATRRWRESIGKLLLHHELSTVVLRN